jgi:cyclase
MAKKRLIPKLLLSPGSNNPSKQVLVITKQYGVRIEVGNPISTAKIFQAQGADELILSNISPSVIDYPTLRRITNQLSEEIFMPITVGGGITTVDQFKELLSDGADKISVNTAAVNNRDLITKASELYGAQCVVLSIDYKKDKNGNLHVFTNGGKTDTGMHPVEWAIEAEKLGAGEILFTSIDHDGMREGLDVKTISDLCKSVSIPVIASGGCSLPQHFIDGYGAAHLEAIAAGTFFAFKDQSFMQIRSAIKNAGIDIRVYT